MISSEKCIECGYEILTEHSYCLNCGYKPIKPIISSKQKMLLMLSVFAASSIIIIMMTVNNSSVNTVKNNNLPIAEIKQIDIFDDSKKNINQDQHHEANLDSTLSNSQECKQIFRNIRNQAIQLDDIRNKGIQLKLLSQFDKLYFEKALDISNLITKKTKEYLDNCTDKNIPINKQKDKLLVLATSATLNCPKRETYIQDIDINKDGIFEMILHSTFQGCSNYYSRFNTGFSILFYFNKKSNTWNSHSIWPVELLNLKSKISEWKIDPQYHPNIYMLPYSDSKNRFFMAIESEYGGGDHGKYMLNVIRWNEFKPTLILDIGLTDWCGQSTDWSITDMKVVIPEAEATERCGKREKEVYSLEQP
jgi:hypothetical protein